MRAEADSIKHTTLRAGDQEDGDVVTAALLVGGLDESLAGGLECEGGSAGEDVGNLGVGEFAGEAVGGEQVEVSGLGGVGGDLGLDFRLRPYGSGDDVTDGRVGSLGAVEEAGAYLLLDEGVVAGELMEFAVAKEIATAVADVSEPERGVAGRLVPEQGDERGAHAAQGAKFLRALEDGVVGSADGLPEAGVGMVGGIRIDVVLGVAGRGLAGDAGGLAEAVQEGLGSEMAGHFAAGGATHAIAYDENALFGQGGAGVLVGVSHTTAVGEHGEGMRGRRRWYDRSGGEWDLRLGKL